MIICPFYILNVNEAFNSTSYSSLHYGFYSFCSSSSSETSPSSLLSPSPSYSPTPSPDPNSYIDYCYEDSSSSLYPESY